MIKAPLIVSVWGKEVAAVVWDNNREYAILEFFPEFENAGIDLAPAYDLCYSYSSTGRWTNQHQMSANNKRDNFTRDDLLTVGRSMGVKKVNLLVEQIMEVVFNWNKYADDFGVAEFHKKQIGKNLRLL